MVANTWLYKVVFLTSGLSSGAKQSVKFEEQISELGMRGWELIAVTSSNQAIFKKPR